MLRRACTASRSTAGSASRSEASAAGVAEVDEVAPVEAPNAEGLLKVVIVGVAEAVATGGVYAGAGGDLPHAQHARSG